MDAVGQGIGCVETGGGDCCAGCAAGGGASGAAGAAFSAGGVSGSVAAAPSVGGTLAGGMVSFEDSSPLSALRKSRSPRPSERPTSGSRFGPSTSNATTSTNRRCVG